MVPSQDSGKPPNDDDDTDGFGDDDDAFKFVKHFFGLKKSLRINE